MMTTTNYNYHNDLLMEAGDEKEDLVDRHRVERHLKRSQAADHPRGKLLKEVAVALLGGGQVEIPKEDHPAAPLLDIAVRHHVDGIQVMEDEALPNGVRLLLPDGVVDTVPMVLPNQKTCQTHCPCPIGLVGVLDLHRDDEVEERPRRLAGTTVPIAC